MHAMIGQETDALFAELDEITTEENTEVIATFKSTRLIIGQSTERVRNEQLHLRISHVFGEIKGIDNFFDLDNLNNMHISLEYGLTDNIQLGLMRSNKPDKTYSTTIKWSALRQKIGKKTFPFSLSYYGNIDFKTRSYTPEARDKNFKGRIDYINQLLVARKVSPKISLQIAPTWVHRNLTDTNDEPNDIYSIGLGGRYLFSRSTSINLEYYYALPTFDSNQLDQNTLTLGFDIETGGHVFQLYFTNAIALHPGKFAINQSNNFFEREINFGFSILRAFNVGKKISQKKVNTGKTEIIKQLTHAQIMKNLAIILLAASSLSSITAQEKLTTRTGKTTFLSKTPMEDIYAENNQSASIFVVDQNKPLWTRSAIGF